MDFAAFRIDARKAKSATLINPGNATGSSTRHKIWSELHPSIAAESSNSRGIPSNEFRNMNTENGI
jgi:hypothetical protein